ncbi:MULTISPECIES: helix-turn-helix domain-containing protein [unclassified Rhizobium]|uniref:helix-turn-helix domain-containing protein n=1 Tax=unclassified Rhizobium TaxID=2613769 RepID=UPI0007136462|nr:MULTISPECIES: helix-turn-helix transcriptional regulator [unclassified Rhizobium]KQT06783.1 Cro/Cl family transcriptional regulator [Rhizobium sp. Leaf386]KQU05929.1 Cro/Cl family transcriptional regulator [Rhizobium sp. Leaf453]
MMNRRKPDPIDVHVGTRIRTRRRLIGMSQTGLGNLLSVTFQQVQKYEKGTNRVGSSRLAHIAEVLDVPVSFFFEDDPSRKGMIGSSSVAVDPVGHFIDTKDGLDLNRAFFLIKDERVRRSIIKMAETLAKSSQAPEQLG